jgi:hypothetical protein
MLQFCSVFVDLVAVIADLLAVLRDFLFAGSVANIAPKLRSIFSQFLMRLGALSFPKLISATISVFQIKQVALTWDLNLLDAAVLNLTRENGDSTTFDVRKCFQCSRGKS